MKMFVPVLLVVVGLSASGLGFFAYAQGFKKGLRDGRAIVAQEEFSVELENIQRLKGDVSDQGIRDYAKMRLYHYARYLPPGRLGGVPDFGPVPEAISVRLLSGKGEGTALDDYLHFQNAKRGDAGK